jgi:hypothetical protein
MNWPETYTPPTTRTLRHFSALWIVFFLGLATWQVLLRDRTTLALVLAAVALTIGLLGLMKPSAVRPIFVLWMKLASPLGWIVSHLLLAIVYYGVFTPLALVFRVMGRNPLKLRRPVDAKSYWTPKPAPRDVRSYFRQF